MKAAEIREKSAEDLGRLEDKLRQELAALRIQARAGQLAETSKIGTMKRDIARILTIRAEPRSQAGSEPQAPQPATARKTKAKAVKTVQKKSPKKAGAKSEGKGKK